MKMKRKEKQRIRRFSALLLSLMLICAMSMTAFAADGTNPPATETEAENTTTTAETGSGQKVDLSKHSFTAYQIFSGEYDPQSKKLSNIDWGKNATDPEIQKAIAEAVLGTGASADLAKILDVLGKVENETTVANNLAAAIASKAEKLGDGELVWNGYTVDPGYYIVIDTTDDIGSGESRNFALLQCIDGTIKINTKTGTVSSDKQVMDTNDSDSSGSLGTSADYDIGDEVPFELTGTVADKFELFQGPYKFVFHDTESEGLTFNANSVEVTIDGAQIGDGYEVVLNPGDGETFQVIFADLKKISGVHAGSVIKISYTATLNDKAVIGAAGNDNTMYLEYSNNPSGGGETGQTPEKKVIVFTYKVGINKVDQDNKPLEGAGFTLYKVDKTYNADDGAGKKNADGTIQNVWNGVTYNKEVPISTKNSTKTFFSFEGIDDGKYLLVETATPAGYNSIEPIAFTVTVDHSTGELSLKGEGVDVDPITGEALLAFTADKESGALTREVVNKSGSLLPSTGGIGTTMFYIIGGVLMVGACMMLFVRKIMTNEKR